MTPGKRMTAGWRAPLFLPLFLGLAVLLAVEVSNHRQQTQLLARIDDQGRAIAELGKANERLAHLLGELRSTPPVFVAGAAAAGAAPVAAAAPAAEAAEPPPVDWEMYNRASTILQRGLDVGQWTQEDANEFRVTAMASGPKMDELFQRRAVAMSEHRLRADFAP